MAQVAKVVNALWSWFSRPLPLQRVAVLRRAAAAFVLIDLFVLRPWIAGHGLVPTELHHPVLFARLLGWPAPTSDIVVLVQVSLVACAVAGLLGVAPRLTGALTFGLYFEWVMIAYSYGKVDHDQFAFLVALAVLPTVKDATLVNESDSESAGWALSMIQVAVVATYFLSVYAKLRFGGIEWLQSATIARVILRRGTFLAEPLLDVAWALAAVQYAIVAFELASPLMLMRNRWGRGMAVAAYAFHFLTFAGVRIMFWPQLVCLLAFFPLERIPRRLRFRIAAPRPSPHSTRGA